MQSPSFQKDRVYWTLAFYAFNWIFLLARLWFPCLDIVVFFFGADTSLVPAWFQLALARRNNVSCFGFWSLFRIQAAFWCAILYFWWWLAWPRNYVGVLYIALFLNLSTVQKPLCVVHERRCYPGIERISVDVVVVFSESRCAVFINLRDLSILAGGRRH